jgi:APA family basic amino acid/polyamine antiporter
MAGNNSESTLGGKIGLLPVTNIVIANMVGTGIFTTSGLLMGNLDNPMLMILLWFAGGFIALIGALCYGRLGKEYPLAGGEYIFLSKLYHPLFGFLSGWVSFIVGFSAPIAAASIGFSEYFVRAFPQILNLNAETNIITVGIVKRLLSVSVIAIFTLIHLKGIRYSGKVQNYLTLLKVGLILTLVILGFSSGKGETANIFNGSSYNFNLSGWKSIGLSMMWIMFAYSGWNASTYIGSEIKRPERNIVLSLFMGTGLVIILYMLLNTLYIYAIKPDEMKGVISIGGLAAQKLFGTSIDKVFSLLLSFALFSAISAFIILGPRIYYAMARNNHFFKFAGRVHPKSHVPALSIILQGGISIIMIVSGTFDQILTYMGFSLAIFPVLTVLGTFFLKYNKISAGLIYKSAAVIFSLIYICILVLSFMERSLESSIAIGTVIIGIPAFYLFTARK